MWVWVGGWVNAVIGALVSPRQSGSAYVLLHHVMGEAAGSLSCAARTHTHTVHLVHTPMHIIDARICFLHTHMHSVHVHTSPFNSMCISVHVRHVYSFAHARVRITHRERSVRIYAHVAYVLNWNLDSK